MNSEEDQAGSGESCAIIYESRLVSYSAAGNEAIMMLTVMLMLTAKNTIGPRGRIVIGELEAIVLSKYHYAGE